MDAEALADLFAAFGPIRVRRMFGGQGIYADGVMFALVAFDDVYLKVDADLARRLEAEGARPFVYEAKGRKVSLGYWTLPTERIDDPDAVAEVAHLALGVARRAAAHKSATKRRRGQPPDIG